MIRGDQLVLSQLIFKRNMLEILIRDRRRRKRKEEEGGGGGGE